MRFDHWLCHNAAVNRPNTMSLSFPIPAQSHQTELEIKRSRFLAFVAHTPNPEAANHFLRELRARHPGANHVCWAYIAGAPNSTLMSMSDDGEPSGTAGMPMLKVLQHSGIGEVTVAVVRYFGGTKLGTGGLQRAYSDATSAVLAELPVRHWVQRVGLTLAFDYGFDGAMLQLVSQYDCEQIHYDYQQQIVLTLQVAKAQQQAFCQQATDLCAGKIVIQSSE